MAGIIAPQRERTSRTPTCKPNPPIIVITGAEKTGKSSEAVRGSSSDLVGMTYWIEIGGTEGTADYYGRIPGARYEIVQHDGSYQDILDAIRWAIAQPRVNGKPNMIVLDSVTSLWDMLSDEVALLARHRAVRKAQENRRRAPNLDDMVTEDRDLWNRAKDRWGEVLWLLRRHSGPSLLIARQEIVTAYENGQATRHTTRRIKAEKNLGAAVDAIVELHALGEAHLTGVRTLHWEIEPGETERFENFSVDALLRRMGFEEAADTRSAHESRPEAYLQEQGNASAQSRPAPAQPHGEPMLTGPQAVDIIRDALMDETNPEAALQGIREQWGIETLSRVTTHTKRGTMSANDLITRSLQYAKEKAKAADGNAGATPSTPPGPPPSQATGDEAREHLQEGEEHAISAAESSPEPPDEGAPPPPDPEGDEEPPGEQPEDVSAAEEPQDLPKPPAPRPRRNKAAQMALDALEDEATVQARLLFLTVGEHLGPISENGDPSMSALRDYLEANRPTVIATLEDDGKTELANAYRNARMPELRIKSMFAKLLDGAPSSR
ncbi:hypothetical protein [Streptomyces sp. NPDC000880]